MASSEHSEGIALFSHILFPSLHKEITLSSTTQPIPLRVPSLSSHLKCLSPASWRKHRPPSPPHGWIMALGFPHRAEDHSSSIFSGFAALLAILLVVAVFCVLWNCSKRKKRESLVCPKLRHTMINCLVRNLKPSSQMAQW